MPDNILSSLLGFYSVTPVHAGSGQSLAAVDLPIQRERHTNWPHIQASAMKGALRAHYRSAVPDKKGINEIFGADAQDGGKDMSPGLLSVSDAKLFAFPMRSNLAPFVMITSPEVLRRTVRDFALCRKPAFPIPQVPDDTAVPLLPLPAGTAGNLLLEDISLSIAPPAGINLPDFGGLLKECPSLFLVPDEAFDYAVSHCTEIRTQVKIDHARGTAAPGALRYQEYLPSDSLMYSVLVFKSSLNGGPQAPAVRVAVETAWVQFVQIGGDDTLGMGCFKTAWI